MVPKRAGPIIGLMCSGLIMITTLYKYFVLFSLPWYVVQGGYMGIIGLSLLWIFISGELSRVRISLRLTMVYLIPYLFMLAYSMLVWLIQEGNISNIRRGVVPIGYQMLQIVAVGALCAMLGAQAIRYTVIGYLLGNLAILASVLLSRGIGTGISEMVNFFVHMGGVDNLTSKGLEIHDLTFAFGELLIFYFAFGSREKKRWLFLALCTFFFIIGWKRIAIPGIIAVIVYVRWIRKKNEDFQRRVTSALGLAMTVVAFLFIVIVREGVLEKITDTYGINMMGRTQLYKFIEPHYQIKATYIGHGIGYITEIMREAYVKGVAVLNQEESIHSDILARYVELGMPGNFIWSLMYYWLTFRYISKKQSVEVGLVFFVNLVYCYITYFTDNTVSYYHINLVLRMLPICKALEPQESIISVMDSRRKEKVKAWQNFAKQRRR